MDLFQRFDRRAEGFNLQILGILEKHSGGILDLRSTLDLLRANELTVSAIICPSELQTLLEGTKLVVGTKALSSYKNVIKSLC
ncbi:hypothetical protein Pmar_PMAR011626 [Perkinsus marinus ATCC 50983]|uniref:Uncharacterized protein n=1 Tax=Perkinsus marinus (strain ATCC 50983 / TXsc) TaxID=423536 RepID=C5LCB2_PERM5|nr:hypothetical protein Pmar_PMAR011626 [Perkinsus marinus ATCC 50983]EER05595.1 hypothetical protein Pmar_PMAR011626 [Perkinsus marinus ATCC 50983]|eukprot:XP_002773779.1 hypothetical protein Pmar_PMAR011626 [Perkinsus marinus ATCC 50983]